MKSPLLKLNANFIMAFLVSVYNGLTIKYPARNFYYFYKSVRKDSFKEPFLIDIDKLKLEDF